MQMRTFDRRLATTCAGNYHAEGCCVSQTFSALKTIHQNNSETVSGSQLNPWRTYINKTG